MNPEELNAAIRRAQVVYAQESHAAREEFKAAVKPIEQRYQAARQRYKSAVRPLNEARKKRVREAAEQRDEQIAMLRKQYEAEKRTT